MVVQMATITGQLSPREKTDDAKRASELAIVAILSRLGSPEPQLAWEEFLRSYSALILQVVRLYESDDDRIADCFLFVCQQLSLKQCRRLRKFQAGGPATFATWLRAVIRHLCVDSHRQQCGRDRVFRSILSLSAMDQQVFRYAFAQGMSLDHALAALIPDFPAATAKEVAESFERVQNSLTARQLWLLSARNASVEALDTPPEDGNKGLPNQIRDTSPDPEALAMSKQISVTLLHTLTRLSNPERLLIRLRFEEELTLEQIARLTGLADAQTVDRRIRQILDCMRRHL